MKEVKQEVCKDLEAREGRGRRRTCRTFSSLSHQGHRRVEFFEEKKSGVSEEDAGRAGGDE